MMTPAELVAELAHRGRQGVTSRVLTDWCSKGLLPPLTSRGRGQAKGRAYAWIEPNIAERTGAVYDLFARHLPADTVLVAIWILGFDVDFVLLRNAWLREWHRLKVSLDRKSVSSGSLEDALGAVVRKVARKARRRYGIAPDKIEPGMEEMAKLAASPEYTFDEDAKFLMIEGASDFFAETGWAGRNFPSLENIKWDDVAEFERSWLPIDRTRAIIASAEIGEFELGHRHWLTIWELVVHIFPEWREGRVGCGLTPAEVWSIVFGRQLIPMLLHLIKLGHDSQIERTLIKSGEFIRQFDSWSIYSALINRARLDDTSRGAIAALFGELAEIWGSDLLALVLGLPRDWRQ